MATVIGRLGSAPLGQSARMLIFDDFEICGTIGGGSLEQAVIHEAVRGLHDRKSKRLSYDLSHDLGMCCGGTVEVLIDVFYPKPRLFLFGAGHVSKAIGEVFRSLDFELHVVDDRPEQNTTERFCEAARHVVDARHYATELNTRPGDFAIVLTHDHALDFDLVLTLITTDHLWLGMIGSRSKRLRFEKRLSATGLSTQQIKRLHTPVGLDLGAESAAEIAVSIAAQLVQARRRTVSSTD